MNPRSLNSGANRVMKLCCSIIMTEIGCLQVFSDLVVVVEDGCWVSCRAERWSFEIPNFVRVLEFAKTPGFLACDHVYPTSANQI